MPLNQAGQPASSLSITTSWRGRAVVDALPLKLLARQSTGRLQTLELVVSNRRITVIDMEEPPEHHHFLVQAPVAPADVDGLAVVTVGTAIFGLVSVVFAFAYDWLAARDQTLWLQVSVAGFVLGLVGLAYCWRRRRRRRAGPSDHPHDSEVFQPDQKLKRSSCR